MIFDRDAPMEEELALVAKLSDVLRSVPHASIHPHVVSTGPDYGALARAAAAFILRDVYRSATLFWKAEALLQAARAGDPLDRLLIAAAIPVPIPYDVALAHMEKAKVAVAKVWPEVEKA